MKLLSNSGNATEHLSRVLVIPDLKTAGALVTEREYSRLCSVFMLSHPTVQLRISSGYVSIRDMHDLSWYHYTYYSPKFEGRLCNLTN